MVAAHGKFTVTGAQPFSSSLPSCMLPAVLLLNANNSPEFALGHGSHGMLREVYSLSDYKSGAYKSELSHEGVLQIRGVGCEDLH